MQYWTTANRLLCLLLPSGPYIKWFLEKLGHDGLNRMLGGLQGDWAEGICDFSPLAVHMNWWAG